MAEKSSSSDRHLPYVIQIFFFLVIFAITAIGLYEISQHTFSDEGLRFAFCIILIIALILEAELTRRIVLKAAVFESRSKETNSLTIHFCHNDPERSFFVNKKKMPLCSRHFGFYIGLLFVAVVSLIIPSIWLILLDHVGLVIYLAIGVLLLALSVIGGTIGRAYHIKGQNKLRFTLGILTALAWIFLGISIIYLTL